MELQEILGIQARAVKALADALEQAVDDDWVQDKESAVKFAQAWAASVASVDLPASVLSKPQPY